MEKMSKVRYQDWPSSNDTEEKRWSKDGVKMSGNTIVAIDVTKKKVTIPPYATILNGRTFGDLNVWKYPVLTCWLNLRTFPKN